MQSNLEHESQSEEYLCDYIYIDNVKLSHYYSQLSSHGLVVNSKRVTKDIGKQGSSGHVKIPVLSGSMVAETSNEHSLELSIDSAFSRPQETLDALYESGYIRSGLNATALGELVLEKGSISLFDIRMLKDIWMDMGDFAAASSTTHISNVKEKQRTAALKKKEFETIAKIIAKMPHSLQGTLSTLEEAAWFTLKPECLLANAEDLSFKHGSSIKGEWHVLGILDAIPDYLGEESAQLALPSPIESAMTDMLSALRGLLGRPSYRYGITPVMIFRTIKKPQI